MAMCSVWPTGAIESLLASAIAAPPSTSTSPLSCAHGTASADRFQTAQSGSSAFTIRPSAGSSVTAENGRLRSSGLDAEVEATTAYAQFMLAWGLGCLGERMLLARMGRPPRKKLARASGTGADPAGHGILSEMFSQRVRDAQEGRPPKLGMSPELASRHDALTFLRAIGGGPPPRTFAHPGAARAQCGPIAEHNSGHSGGMIGSRNVSFS